MTGSIALLCLLTAAAAWHPWGKPRCKSPDAVLLQNNGYDCCYSPRLRVSRWTGYEYSSGPGEPRARFRGRFTADPRLGPDSSPLPRDYSGCGRLGLDRGHLAPDAAVKRLGTEAQRQTYLLTNITPQYRLLNRNLWRELESAIRDWAGTSETVRVCTGPVFYAGRDTQWLGKRRVAVPHAYFCAIRRGPKEQALCLLVPNRPERRSWSDAAKLIVSIDSVEKLTGLDLYPGLPASAERRIERQPAAGLWNSD